MVSGGLERKLMVAILIIRFDILQAVNEKIEFLLIFLLRQLLFDERSESGLNCLKDLRLVALDHLVKVFLFFLEYFYFLISHRFFLDDSLALVHIVHVVGDLHLRSRFLFRLLLPGYNCLLLVFLD